MHVYPEPSSRHLKAASMLLLWDAVQCAPMALVATARFNDHRTAAGLAAAALTWRRKSQDARGFWPRKIAPAVIVI